MRFKFKAWHDDEKVMIENEEQGFEGGVFKWFDEGQAVTILQYTGMEDSNGKEIYEGDIVKQVHAVPEEEVTSFCSVEFNDGMFIVHDEKFSEWDPLKDNAYSCEVVGNIYENPELIKKYAE